MHNASIILLFLITKIFQWVNSFVLAYLFSVDKSSVILLSIVAVIFLMFVIIFLVKKFFSKNLKKAWMIIIAFMVIGGLINKWVAIVGLLSIWLYALIGLEAEVFHSLSNYKNIPRSISFLFSLVPIALFYLLPQQFRLLPEEKNLAPQLFYIITTVLALIYSYFKKFIVKQNDTSQQKAPFIWFGLFFLFASCLLYYVGFYKTDGDSLVLSFVILFYIGGATMTYAGINRYLRNN
ncbi:MAG: hypothetical protein N2692_01750 [Patescibacteria group bacterium]|jgi:hypothetical protein|nr:hypothetical protein [Patescibacteria group bacterium]